MVCDITPRRNQTLSQRKEEVRRTVSALDKAITAGLVRVRVDRRSGAVAFAGWTSEQRNAISDACAYRRLMVEGSATAKVAIARAEAMAGRTVDRQALAAGIHSHDGGRTWNEGH